MLINQIPEFSVDVYFELKNHSEKFLIASTHELLNKIFLENLVENEHIELFLNLLENHYATLDLLSKIERHLLIPKWSLFDKIEQINDCLFVPMSDCEFYVKFYDKHTNPIVKDFDKKLRLGDFIYMKLADESGEVFFHGKNYDPILLLFANWNSEKFPEQINYKKGVLRIGFNSHSVMVSILQLFFSFVLSAYQLWKLNVITESRFKKLEGSLPDARTLRNVFQTENGKIVGLSGENKYFKYKMELREVSLLYMPRVVCWFIRQRIYHG